MRLAGSADRKGNGETSVSRTKLLSGTKLPTAQLPGRSQSWSGQGNVGNHYNVVRRFILACRHEVKYSPPYPETGDEIYCLRCNTGTIILRAQLYWTCWSCRPPHTEFNGLAQITNETRAARHFFKNPSHRVYVYDERGLVYKRFRRDENIEPTLDSTITGSSNVQGS